MNNNYEVLKKYVKPDKIQNVFDIWNEPHRKFHTSRHLFQVLNGIRMIKTEIKSEKDWDALILAAYFHDAVYIPGNRDNEILSAKILTEFVINPLDEVVVLANEIILSTQGFEKKDGIFELFQKADCDILINGTISDFVVYEKEISKEFQRFSWLKYKNGRLEFIRKAMELFPGNVLNLQKLFDHVANFNSKIGIYAGSFNPFHVGHLNVLQQAESLFDKVVIARGQNSEKEKNDSEFNPVTISDREIVSYSGFLSTYLKEYEKSGCEVTLIRGLRNEYDLNYEQNLVQYIKDQMPSLRVVFFLCDKKFEHVSSGAIRALEKIEKGSGQMYIVK